MCECVKLVNVKLAHHNGKVATGFMLTGDMGIKMRVLIATEKVDKARRKPVPPLTASFCPFCGTKVE